MEADIYNFVFRIGTRIPVATRYLNLISLKTDNSVPGITNVEFHT